MFHKLRSKISEPYRIKVGFGLSPIRNKRELKALMYFCKEQLKEEHIQRDTFKKNILENTIKLYETNDSNIVFYISDNCGVYWS